MIPVEFWNACKTYGKQTGADPVLLAAIGRHETGYGTLGAGRSGYALGYGVYSPTNMDPRFRGLENQLLYAGKQIDRYMKGAPVTPGSVLAFSVNSWKAGNPQAWAASVWACYANLTEELHLALPVAVAPVQKEEEEEMFESIVACFGTKDIMNAVALSEKFNAPICSQAQTALVGKSKVVYWVGGVDHAAVEGQTFVNLCGDDFKETMTKVIAEL